MDNQSVEMAVAAGLPAEEGFEGRHASVDILLGFLAPDSFDHETALVSTVEGLAGIGKTALAVHVGHRAVQAGWFPGGVLFQDLQGYDSKLRVDGYSALGSFLRVLGVSGDRIPEEPGAREAMFREVMESRARSGHRTLILADNASSVEQVRPLRPGGSSHRILVTSRNALPLGGTRHVELDVLPVAEAIDMVDALLRAARPTDDRITSHFRDVVRLVELCGHLPLALRITAELLVAHPERSLAELNEIYADERERLLEMDYDESLAVRVAFEQSYRQLPKEHARMFRLLTVNRGPYVSLAAAAALAGHALGQTRRLLDGLRRANLIHPVLLQGRYRFHDLILLFAREKCNEKDMQAERVAATRKLLDYYRDHAQAADTFIDPRVADDNRSAAFSDREKALVWLDAERPNLVAAVALAEEAGYDEHAQDIPLALFFYFSLRKHWDDWIGTYQIGIKAAERRQDPGSEAKLLNNLGAAYSEQRHYDQAINHLLRARSLYQQVGDRYGEARTYNGVGDTYTEMARFDEAIEELRHAHEIRCEIDDRHGQGRSLSNLGLAHVGLGRFEDAIRYLAEGLAFHVDLEDLYAEGRARAGLGRAYLGQADHDRAITEFLRAIDIHRRLTDRHSEAATLRNLGVARQAMGHLSEAYDCFLEARIAFADVGAEDDVRQLDALLADLKNIGNA